MAEKSIARLVIHRAGEMSPYGREDIAQWLRKQAEQLERDGENYSKVFTARYLENEREAK